MFMINSEVETLKKRKNVYLIGFMGVGKTAVARTIARKLHMTFIDSDREIKAKAGQSIEAIFNEENGEARFRKLEREFIEEGHPDYNCIVACGGGLPIAEGILDLLKSRGVVFALFAKTSTIHQRTDRRSVRPLLMVEDKEKRINELLERRQHIYTQAHHLIFSEGRPVEAVACDIMRIYVAQERREKRHQNRDR